MAQPQWKLVAQLGDVHPLDYDGLFVYVDETGVYPPEAEKLFAPEDDFKGRWEVRCFVLENLKTAEYEGRTLLIPAKYDSSWPHPLQSYDEWFNRDLEKVAATVGVEVEWLRDSFVSDKPEERARAWEAVGEHHGWDNLDSEPLYYNTREEIEARYAADGPRMKVGR